MNKLKFLMIDIKIRGGRYRADFRVIKDGGTLPKITNVFFEIKSEDYAVMNFRAKCYYLDQGEKKPLSWDEASDILGVSSNELSRVAEDAEKYMKSHRTQRRFF